MYTDIQIYRRTDIQIYRNTDSRHISRLSDIRIDRVKKKTRPTIRPYRSGALKPTQLSTWLQKFDKLWLKIKITSRVKVKSLLWLNINGCPSEV